MYIFLLLLCSILFQANGKEVSSIGKSVIDSLEPDTGKARNSAFWKNWFEEFSLKTQDDSECVKEGYFAHRRTCHRFTRCVYVNETDSFQKYDFSCAPGTTFDVNRGKCQHTWMATTDSECEFEAGTGEASEHKRLFNTYDTEDFFVGFETEKYCVYDLHMHYLLGSPDGVLKRIIGFNGQFPGPTITCTRGKIMIVRVTNSIADDDEPTSIHWHGIEQNTSPFSDGPESVTQCGIIRDTSMIYKFELFQSGTYWYHSHHSYQYVDGAWGFLIVRNTPREVWQNAYDEELTISVNDWTHLPARELSEIYLTRGNFPDCNASLINARGTFNCSNVEPGQVCNPALQYPAVINVIRGKRYRLRVLNAAGARTYNFSIDNHKMVAIETDGVDTFMSPQVDVVSLLPANRYSLLVTMNQPLQDYWIRISGEGPPSPGLLGRAILRYSSTASLSPQGTSDGTIAPEAILPAAVPEPGAVQGRPDFQNIPWSTIASSGGIRAATPRELKAFFPFPPPSIVSRQNDIEAKIMAEAQMRALPTTSPVDPSTAILLNQNDCPPYDVGGNGGAPNFYDQLVTIVVQDCPTAAAPSRQCMNGLPFTPNSPNTLPVLFQVIKGQTIAENNRPIYTPILGKVIRMVINNHHEFPHPWHLHGHTFWVLGDGAAEAGDYVEARDGPTLNYGGVRRDTTFTLGSSWAVMTWITGNPGTWFMHCHINWHLEAGLGVTFIEGAEVAQDVYGHPPLQAFLTCAAVGVNIY